MGFEPIPKISRSAEVKERLLQAISAGDFRPGDRLPSESELQREFAVSRASIREALHALESVGLIETKHGRGSFVRFGPSASYANSFSQWLKVHEGEFADLMSVRGSLEQLAAREAARLISSEGAEKLRAVHERFEQAARSALSTNKVLELVQIDIDFHNLIAELSQNVVLPDLLRALNNVFRSARRAAFSIEGQPLVSLAEHEVILESVCRGDESAARGAARAHSESAKSVLLGLILEGESET